MIIQKFTGPSCDFHQRVRLDDKKRLIIDAKLGYFVSSMGVDINHGKPENHFALIVFKAIFKKHLRIVNDFKSLFLINQTGVTI